MFDASNIVSKIYLILFSEASSPLPETGLFLFSRLAF
jgi:hypothetical protein